MVDKEQKELVTLKELLMSNVYTQEALVNLLERKGILTQKEVLEEIKTLQLMYQQAKRK